MKFSTSLITIVVTAFLAGCGSKEQSSTPPAAESKPANQLATDAQKAVSTAVTEVKQSAEKAATDAKQAAAKTEADAKQSVEKTAADATKPATAATSQAQGLIDRAKSLITDKKYQDALGSLSQLGNLQLTPEQQKQVSDLKAQLEKLLAGQTAADATKAASGLLDGKK